jgi:hypothetical protein
LHQPSSVELVSIRRDCLSIAQHLPSVDLNILIQNEIKSDSSGLYIGMQLAALLHTCANYCATKRRITLVLVGAAWVSRPLLQPKMPAAQNRIRISHHQTLHSKIKRCRALFPI